MMSKLASNKAFNAIKGIAKGGPFAGGWRPSLIEGTMLGAMAVGGAAIWAGLKTSGGVNKRLEKEGYLKRGVGYTGKM